MMSESEAARRGIQPLARRWAYNVCAGTRGSTAPVHAIGLYERTGWSRDDVDLYEINEAFAVVRNGAIRDLQLDDGRSTPIRMRAHPIGIGRSHRCHAIAVLQRHNLKRGVAALCIGGGEATAPASRCLASRGLRAMQLTEEQQPSVTRPGRLHKWSSRAADWASTASS